MKFPISHFICSTPCDRFDIHEVPINLELSVFVVLEAGTDRVLAEAKSKLEAISIAAFEL